MANGTSAAVTEAARLDEIGFPEFTTKLVTDVFDALVASSLRQTEAYMELLKNVNKNLKEFINDTRDDISGDMILQFLAAVLPPEDPESEDATKVKEGATLTGDEATALNNALVVTHAEISDDNQVADTTAIDTAKRDAILDAVANRISANKYDLLKEMVRQGMLRIVVENGVIETKLTFTTYGSSFHQKNATDYNRKKFAVRAKTSTGSFLSPWVKASASTSYSSVRVRTTKETQRDISGSRVNIFGHVQINFKSDYQPLNQ